MKYKMSWQHHINFVSTLQIRPRSDLLIMELCL